MYAYGIYLNYPEKYVNNAFTKSKFIYLLIILAQFKQSLYSWNKILYRKFSSYTVFHENITTTLSCFSQSL